MLLFCRVCESRAFHSLCPRHSCTVAAKKENKFMLLVYISPETMNSQRCQLHWCGNRPVPCVKSEVP